VQIEQDSELCATKFPGLVCRAVAAQFMAGDLIALFEFEQAGDGIKMSTEKHYRLIRSEELSQEELDGYGLRQV
jgi:hypothetical protein